MRSAYFISVVVSSLCLWSTVIGHRKHNCQLLSWLQSLLHNITTSEWKSVVVDDQTVQELQAEFGKLMWQDDWNHKIVKIISYDHQPERFHILHSNLQIENEDSHLNLMITDHGSSSFYYLLYCDSLNICSAPGCWCWEYHFSEKEDSSLLWVVSYCWETST